MLFTPKPAVRQLSLAFSLLLIALPAAIKAADDKLGPALPPPSLYEDVPAGSPSSAPAVRPAQVPSQNPAGRPAPVPTQAAPVQQPPLVPDTPASDVSKSTPPATPAVSGTRNAAAPSERGTVAGSEGRNANTPPEAVAVSGARNAREPWYKRMFSWLIPSSRPRVEPEPITAAAADTNLAMAEPTNGRPGYAYAAPSEPVRTGFLGQCVRMGMMSAGSGDCDSAAAREQTPEPPTQVAAIENVPVAPAQVEAPAANPVEVVPLPEDDAASGATALDDATPTREEVMTALADTRPMPEPDYDKLTLSAGAAFPLSSTAIKPLGREKLDELVARLKEMDYETVHVVGHTDPTGPRALNERLSKQRANAVKKYLVSKGIDAKRIRTEGKGGAEPLPKTRDCDSLPRMEKIICYAPDRRVEIEVIGGEPRS